MQNGEVAQLLAAAVAAQRAGRDTMMVEKLKAVLNIQPEHPQALNSLGVRALANKDAAAAANYFSRAAAVDPKEAVLWLNLAHAQRMLGDDEAERKSLLHVLEIDRRHFMALVRKAELHERLGEDAAAAHEWWSVLQLAAALEHRTPALEQMLAHAGEFVAAHNAKLAATLDEGLRCARQSFDGAELRRFDACIGHITGKRKIFFNECTGVHFPFLPADEFFPRRHFPWMEELEARTDAIRAELRSLLSNDEPGFAPYVANPPGTPPDKWSELDHSTRWSAYYLWEYGIRNEDHCKRCPATAAALDAMPLATLPGRAPTAFFSLLKPRTKIPPHTGVTNTRTIIHLPLIVPEGCGFRVGGEARQWRVGEAFAFDDTIEHEAWNDSDELRAVLIFDVWNPHLTEAEKALLSAFYEVADQSGHNPDAL